MAAPHSSVCLLRNPRLAVVATLLFAGNGFLDLLKLPGVGSAIRHDPLLPFLLAGSAVLDVILFNFFTCLAERLILALMLAGVLLKMLSVLEPGLFADIGKYQRIAAALISFSCAAISAFAAARSLRTPGPGFGQRQ
jgi:hypothetical protein